MNNSNKLEKKRTCFLFICLFPITIILLFIDYLPINFKMELDIGFEHKNGIFASTYRSNQIVEIYYKNKWLLGDDADRIILESYNNSFDVDRMIFENESGIEKITIYNFSTKIWGMKTVDASGTELGKHTYLNGGIIPSIENGELVLTIENPDESSRFMITGYSFIPVWFWLLYGIIALSINLVLTFIIYHIIVNLKIKHWESQLLSVLLCAVTILLGMILHKSLSYITYDYFFLNWLIVFVVCNFINCLSVHYLGTIVGSGIVLLWYIANYFIILFRQKPIVPSDFYAIGTAGEVIGGYRIVPTIRMILCFVIWIILCIGLVVISRKEKKKISVKKRLAGALSSVVIFVLCLNNPIYNSLNTFVWNAKLLDDFYSEGMVLSFTRNYFSSRVKEPDGYSVGLVDGYLKKYMNEEDTDSEVTKPTRIIMIMNEAFSDLRDSGMSSSIDVMPYIDSLSENTISGTLYASVFGGGTCNTEFEALTGNSMAFLPAGYYPYVQSIKDDMFSLATYFKQLSYNTSAFHPGSVDSWNRNNVYSLFSFDDYYSENEYEDIEYVHKLPSDLSNYRFSEKIDQRTDKPYFMFNVTYQNHSGYESWDNVPKNENALSIPATDAQVYLSLIAESDKAIEQMIEYYKADSVPTMIIFFGDHQPGLGVENDYYIYNNNVSGLNKYKTKFFIWANYDIEEKADVNLSANYLPLLVLETGGFKLPPYLKMLKDVYEEYPIVSAQGIVDKEGNLYSGVDDLKDDQLIKMYRYIQYANMFDDINDDWFATK